MDRNSLRIGNRISYSGMEWIVRGISAANIQAENTISGKIEDIDFKDVIGIPIAEEKLLKLGFESWKGGLLLQAGPPPHLGSIY